MSATIVVLHGDETGEDLLIEALRIIDPSVIGCDLSFVHFDLSLKNRRKTNNRVVHEAAASIKQHSFGLKAATITPTGIDDVSSPNAILREEIGAQVILRTGRPLPGTMALGSISTPITVVRMAVDDAYNAKEWREVHSGDEIAFRTEHISRNVCRIVAATAFHYAAEHGGIVFGGPKFTVSKVYEGMLKEELDAMHEKLPSIPYDPQLIDATYALLIRQHGKHLVIPALNRDGDCLSDLILSLFGSIAGAESLIIGFDSDALIPTVVVAEAPHGTAPSLWGKNIANPMGMILAASSLLSYIDDSACSAASRTIQESIYSLLQEGIATNDLNGNATTTVFTDEILLRTKLALGTSRAP